MADIDLQLVREFFELNRFQVTTHWRHHDPQGHPDGGFQIYAQNAAGAVERELDTLLRPEDLAGIARAVVEVRAWHADRFYASLLDSNPVITQFAEPWALAPAREFFQTEDFKTIVVVSELPRSGDQRAQTVRRVAGSGVDHLIEFPAILQDLSERVVLTGSYTGSPTLQLLQRLKRYRLLQRQQLEFEFPIEPPAASVVHDVDTTVAPDVDE